MTANLQGKAWLRSQNVLVKRSVLEQQHGVGGKELLPVPPSGAGPLTQAAL